VDRKGWGADRVSEGGAREEEGEGVLRREGNRDTKGKRKRRKKIERSHGIMHKPKKKGRSKDTNDHPSCVRMRPLEKTASCDTTLHGLFIQTARVLENNSGYG
jgi:hypothetical protein